ncbi:MAG: PEP-CTERM sorting domain-containing protein, partial [Oceanicoccus sp.]|uniref:PEP-CTERM sorting domain-containing protein n=1 Tax=Oceanicoccus sp. TaxID=2691044 RepID=UPI00261E95F0
DLTGSFTGTWGSPAASAWHGTFTGTPNRTVTTSSNTGINTLDFSGLTLGILPTNTFVALGDLDAGSASGELISFRAWDALGLITTAWLEEPSYQVGVGTQVAEMLPDYQWDPGTSTYTFDGNGETWLGNPSTGVYMLTNQQILTMEINDQTSYAGFGIYAPRSQSPQVPEPATFLLFCTGLIGLARYKKNRLLNQS